MSDLKDYKCVEPIALLEQIEVMQDELEQKDEQIRLLQEELTQLPTLSEWQEVQELLQEQTTQLQEQSLTIQQQTEKIVTLNANDKYLSENQRLKKENAELAAKEEAARLQLRFAKERVLTKEVKVPTYYTKCTTCNKDTLKAELKKQKEKMEKLQVYLMVFELIVGIVIVFTAFNEKVFWKDFKAFFVVLWHIIEVNGTTLYNGYTEMSRYVTTLIENGILQNLLYWLILLLLFAVTFILFCLPFYFMWKAWREKILEALNPLTISISLLLLLIVVYLGEYVKLAVSMNLLGLWLIGTIIIIGGCIYVIDCMKYRR